MVLFLLFWQTLTLLFIPEVSGGMTAVGETHHPVVERYAYRAWPLGDEGEDRPVETVDVEIRQDDDLLQYVSRVTSLTMREVTTITMGRKGDFLSGTKTISDVQGKTLKRHRMARGTDKVSLKTTTGGRVRLEEIDLPGTATLAVDGSLLILLRTFPFETDRTWTIFMVDFSGASITVAARQAGTETIETPAGDFECYRMEVLVNVPLFRPKITYWITRQAPHFLVRSVGKRGPFTDSYEMTLTSRNR